MALFAKDRRKQVAELEQTIEELRVANEASLYAAAFAADKDQYENKQRIAEAVAEIARLTIALEQSQDETRQIIKESNDTTDRARQEHEVSKASYEGMVAILKEKEKRLVAVLHNHDWHRGGSATAHGAELELWECTACRADPGANTRLLVPQGFFSSMPGSG